MFKIVLLTLLSVSVALASIPTGCVKIRNKKTGRYLGAGHNFDDDRRYVDPTSDDRMVIQKNGFYYRIRSQRLNEEMYAAGRRFDLERRVVYTWVPGNSVIQGQWDITPYGSYFLIRNTYWDEYLYCGKGIYSNWIFTWQHRNPSIDDQFLWDIYSC